MFGYFYNHKRKTYFSLALVILSLITFFFLQNKKECISDKKQSNEKNISIGIGHRQIHVLGWYHGFVERDRAQKIMADAFIDAQAGKCKSAQNKISLALTKLAKQKNESLRVLSELETLYQKRPFFILGVEYGPKQYQNEFYNPDTQQDLSLNFISIYKKLCPTGIDLFKELYLVFPGPEYEFVRHKNGLVKIVPLGDDKLIEESFAGYSNESRSFAQQTDTLRPEEQQAYDQFIKHIESGQIPKYSQIEDLVYSLTEPGKTKLQKYFKAASHVLSLIEKRDDRFVEQILKQDADPIVLVVGSAHIPGLRKKLETKCEKN